MNRHFVVAAIAVLYLGPATFTDTPDNLQKLFLEKRMTDFMPVILPTEAQVNEMLKATSHRADEVLGKMAPTFGVFEFWSYTVREAAVNAVMAGAKLEYFPLILAIGSTGEEGISVSDNGFVEALVINGSICDEIGLNYEIGAMGSFALANTTIGRAWNLLSINGGNCGKVGTTYMGTVGNPMNAINICTADEHHRYRRIEQQLLQHRRIVIQTERPDRQVALASLSL